jgi:monoamine oxidase
LSTTAAGYVSLKQLNELQKREFDWLANDNIVQEYAADLSQLSTWWWDNDISLSGPDTFLGVVGGGYTAVINGFASVLGPYIQLNSTVTSVDYSSTRVLVTYKNNMGVSKTVSASKVIVTLPLGVLKAGKNESIFMFFFKIFISSYLSSFCRSLFR